MNDDTDKEIDAMRAVYKAVRALNEEERQRVLEWVDERCRADANKGQSDRISS